MIGKGLLDEVNVEVTRVTSPGSGRRSERAPSEEEYTYFGTGLDAVTVAEQSEPFAAAMPESTLLAWAPARSQT